MNRKIFLLVLLFLSVFSVCFAQRGTSRADAVQIRIGSTLPRNSDWGATLDRIAAEWTRVSNNEAVAVVSHDGREGNEAEMLSKLRSNALQAALFTTSGLSGVCPEIVTLSVPFMIRNNTELDAVLAEILPLMENYVLNDFVVITWSKGGFVYLFSKERVLTPDDLRRQRLAAGNELREISTVLTRMGFSLIDSDMNSIGTRLASNMINAIYFLPAAIAPMQFHRYLGHMMNMPLAPIIGGIVMNRVTWDRLSASSQQQIIRVTRAIAADFDAAMVRTEANAIATMSRNGLVVNNLTPAHEAQWHSDIGNIMPSFVGSVFNRDIYQRVNTILDRVRSGR